MDQNLRRLAFGGLLALTTMAFVSAGPLSAEVVLCVPAHQGAVQAREGHCKNGETTLARSTNTGALPTENNVNMTHANVTPVNAAIECDDEAVHWVKDKTPVN